MCIGVFNACVSVCNTYGGIGSPGAGVTDGYECWESKPGPLEEQPVFIAEPFFPATTVFYSLIKNQKNQKKKSLYNRLKSTPPLSCQQLFFTCLWLT